jgi:hypothetical protein
MTGRRHVMWPLVLIRDMIALKTAAYLPDDDEARVNAHAHSQTDLVRGDSRGRLPPAVHDPD